MQILPNIRNEVELKCKKIENNKAIMNSSADSAATTTKIDGIIDVSGTNKKVSTNHFIEDGKEVPIEDLKGIKKVVSAMTETKACGIQFYCTYIISNNPRRKGGRRAKFFCSS